MSELIGLIPAAGRATRIARLPCSKEVYPVGFHRGPDNTLTRPKIACEYLLDRMRLAEVDRSFIILREGKWDIPAFLRDGKEYSMSLAYLMMDLPWGVPFSLDQAYAFVNNATIAFGFPDIIFWPENAFQKLLKRLWQSNADLVLGLFPVTNQRGADLVDVGSDGRPRSVVIKPKRSELHYAWINALWTPVFTAFMHEYVVDRKPIAAQADMKHQTYPEREHHFGHVIQAGIEQGLSISCVQFPNGSYVDIGTVDNLYAIAESKKINAKKGV